MLNVYSVRLYWEHIFERYFVGTLNLLDTSTRTFRFDKLSRHFVENGIFCGEFTLTIKTLAILKQPEILELLISYKMSYIKMEKDICQKLRQYLSAIFSEEFMEMLETDWEYEELYAQYGDELNWTVN